MPIQDLGPSDMGRRGLDRAQDAIELSRSKRERAPDGAGDATETELQRTAATGSASPGASPARSATDSKAGDRVELSVAARALSAGEDPAVEAQRSQRVSEMRNAVDSGTLATSERIERAARRLLGG